MKAIIQKVSQAKVVVDNKITGAIDAGYLIFLGVEKEDTPAIADKMLQKILALRINEDDNGKMNLNIFDASQPRALLVVSQFTICADLSRGNRPSFNGVPPALAEELYNYFVNQASKQITVATGRFGADMKVSLTNEGPSTWLLEIKD